MYTTTPPEHERHDATLAVYRGGPMRAKRAVVEAVATEMAQHGRGHNAISFSAINYTTDTNIPTRIKARQCC